MLSFLGLSNIPIYLLLAGAVVGAYLVWSNLVAENAILKDTVKVLENGLEQQEQVISNITQEIQQVQEASELIQNENKKVLQDSLVLQQKLSRRIETLAEKKPKLIQNRINKGTKDSNRCLEIASGSALTIQEKNAKKPSEYNSICPSIANPNYTD